MRVVCLFVCVGVVVAANWKIRKSTDKSWNSKGWGRRQKARVWEKSHIKVVQFFLSDKIWDVITLPHFIFYKQGLDGIWSVLPNSYWREEGGGLQLPVQSACRKFGLFCAFRCQKFGWKIWGICYSALEVATVWSARGAVSGTSMPSEYCVTVAVHCHAVFDQILPLNVVELLAFVCCALLTPYREWSYFCFYHPPTVYSLRPLLFPGVVPPPK